MQVCDTSQKEVLNILLNVTASDVSNDITVACNTQILT